MIFASATADSCTLEEADLLWVPTFWWLDNALGTGLYFYLVPGPRPGSGPLFLKRLDTGSALVYVLRPLRAPDPFRWGTRRGLCRGPRKRRGTGTPEGYARRPERC